MIDKSAAGNLLHSISALPRKRFPEWFTFLLWCAPNLLLFLVFTYYPFFFNIYISLTKWNFIDPVPVFVGLDNYLYLFQDSDFWRVLLNTLVYAFCTVFIAQALAFVLALLLNRPYKGMAFFRLLVFTPQVTIGAAAALIWILLLDPQQGPLSILYHILKVPGLRWLANSNTALWAIILVGIWRECSFSAIFFWAGLQNLPSEVLDAARVDGASSWVLLYRIVLPLMTPMIFFLMVSGLIQAVKVFDLVAMMSEGGPVYPASATFVYHLYKLAFRDFQAGTASALAVIFFVLIFGLMLVQLKSSQRWVHHG